MDARVCASCPECHHDRVAQICLDKKIQKAFGKVGDMVDSLSGKDWVAKWEAKVVMAAVTKAQTLKSRRVVIICINGGPHCDKELGRQPLLVRAIKKEMENEAFPVKVEWMDYSQFVAEYAPNALDTQKPGPQAQENKKDQGGQGKGSNSLVKSMPPEKQQGRGQRKEKQASKGTQRKAGDTSRPQQAPRQESDSGDQVWICGECQKEFSTEGAFDQHQQTTGHQDPECRQCGKSFCSEQALNQHQQSTGHNGRRPKGIWSPACLSSRLLHLEVSVFDF